MATTNLISNSLGLIYCQSGNGTPDHTAPKGSIYSNISDGSVWKNLTGSNIWSILRIPTYGEIYMVNNTEPVNSAAANTWYSARALNYKTGSENGIVRDSGALKVLPGYGGTFLIELCASAKYGAAVTAASIGISKNGIVPDIFATGYLPGGGYTRNLSSCTIISLTDNDLIYIVYSSSAITNFVILHANLIVKKISI